MKVAIYSIAKNEAAHVERFMEAVADADEVAVLDTGSSDHTGELIQDCYPRTRVAVGNVMPWRFDDARNASLALVSADADVCICLDLDEVPQPGWREALESAWAPGTTRLRYPFIWSWLEDGSPGVTYYADKIHARSGYRWRLPCHETLAYRGVESVAWADGPVVHHHADASKSRSSYFSLMELALEEAPDDDRMQHYFARELFNHGRMVEASEMFQRHLANHRATWRHERSESMLYLARTGGNAAWTDQWLLRAAAECPERREVWFALAERAVSVGDDELALAFARRCLSLPEDRYYLADPRARGDGVLDRIREISNSREEAA